MEIVNAVATIDIKEKSIVFTTRTTNGEISKNKILFEDFDEWGAVELHDNRYDYHILLDNTLKVFLYGLIDDGQGSKTTDNNNELLCDIKGDFVNDVIAYGELFDSVDVEPHDDVTENFNGTIVGFKNNRTIISVEDMEYNVWDCDVKKVELSY